MKIFNLQTRSYLCIRVWGIGRAYITYIVIHNLELDYKHIGDLFKKILKKLIFLFLIFDMLTLEIVRWNDVIFTQSIGVDQGPYTVVANIG